MTGLELLKAPEATAGEIADIISAPCPPTIPAHCDGVSCRECWLTWLTGEPIKEKEPPDKRTAPDEEGLHPNLVAFLRQRKHLLGVLEDVKDDVTNGQHQLRIEAVDGNFATSVRVFSFSKKETVIKFELVAPEETDAAATKVLVTPTWKIEGAVAKVEACNNGFDAVPTWEDITAMVQINRVYNFTNKTKTASKWGVNIRFTITKNEGFEGEVSISGFGGAYE